MNDLKLARRQLAKNPGFTVRSGLATVQRAEVYRPYTQQCWGFMRLVVRTQLDPGVLTHTVRNELDTLDKDQPFECGMPPTGDARSRISVRFYVVAVSFLVFDVETAFLFAWAVAYWELGAPGTLGAGLFILILLLGLVYEWRKGGLSWSLDRTKTGR